MKPISLSLATLTVVTLAGAAQAATSPQDFIADAIKGDNSEIMLGQLAEQKAGSAGVRDFGKTLVDDHTTAKQQAEDVARTLNVTPPNDPMKEAQDEREKLSGLSGQAFDREFAAYMVKDHEKDIAEFQAEANADHGPAGTLAAKQLPVLQKHLQIAQSLTGSAGAAASNPASFVAQEGPDAWRASKLVGVPVYGPDNKKVGGVTDVLMDHDGKATAVVIGIGGFLGLGQKDVAVQFGDVKFTDEPMPGAAGNQGSVDQNGATSGVAPASPTGLGAPAGSAANGNASGTMATGTSAGTGGASQQRSTAYPDHGVISSTADELKAAPTFQFAK